MIANAQRAKSGYSLHTGLKLADIHPSLGSKFSPNLYKFLNAKEKVHFAKMARVFLDKESVQWLGYLDDNGSFIGQRMSQVLCMGTKVQNYCYANLELVAEHATFWDEYRQDGRCAVDRNHVTSFFNQDTRWSTSGDSRTCLWCKKANQVMHRWTESVEKSAWKTSEGSVAGANL